MDTDLSVGQLAIMPLNVVNDDKLSISIDLRLVQSENIVLASVSEERLFILKARGLIPILMQVFL